MRILLPLALLLGVAACTSARTYAPSPGAPCSMSPPSPRHGPEHVSGPYAGNVFEMDSTSPFIDTDDDAVSTFGADVDDASFLLAKAFLDRWEPPVPAGIRVEEFVNHLDYAYPAPCEDAFSLIADGAPSQFGAGTKLLRIALRGRDANPRRRARATITALVDTSTSMAHEGRLELAKQGLEVLVTELLPGDRIRILSYASRVRVHLPLTDASRRGCIRRAIRAIRAGGASDMTRGLELAYAHARESYDAAGTNRVLLLADGSAQAASGSWRTTPACEIPDLLTEERCRGIDLTVVGFGVGSYNDALLHDLAVAGNGHYTYVNDRTQAHRVFGRDVGSSLEVIARDVKIQVSFDPRVVRSWRLLGYERREMADTAFQYTWTDGGEIGAGHSVTALYEVKLWPEREGSIAAVQVRYVDPESRGARTLASSIETASLASCFEAAAPSFRLAAAAAEFAEILRGTWWARDGSLHQVSAVVHGLPAEWCGRGDVRELEGMISRAASVVGRTW